MSARRFIPSQPLYAGSSLHFSQGIEISEWQAGNAHLSFSLRLPRCTSGDVYLYLPGGGKEYFVNGEPVSAEKITSDLYRVPVNLDGFANIVVNR